MGLVVPPLLESDPDACLRWMAAELGVPVPDPVVLCDRAAALRQIAGAAGVTIDPLIASSFGLAVNVVMAEALSGAPAPEAPEPLATLDFVNDVYTVGGSSTTLAAVVSQPDYRNATGLEIVPGVVPVQYLGAVRDLLFAGNWMAALEVVLHADATVCNGITLRNTSDSIETTIRLNISGSELNYVSANAYDGQGNNGHAILNNAVGFVAAPLPVDVDVAMIFTDAAMWISANGMTEETAAHAVIPFDISFDLALLTGFSDTTTGSKHITFKRVRLYDATDISPVDLPYFAGRPAGAPCNLVRPVVSGMAQVGQTLSCATGTWTGDPIVYTYQWVQGLNVAIEGETASTLVVSEILVDYPIDCRVTATNSAGPAMAKSNVTDPIIPAR